MLERQLWTYWLSLRFTNSMYYWHSKSSECQPKRINVYVAYEGKSSKKCIYFHMTRSDVHSKLNLKSVDFMIPH